MEFNVAAGIFHPFATYIQYLHILYVCTYVSMYLFVCIYVEHKNTYVHTYNNRFIHQYIYIHIQWRRKVPKSVGGGGGHTDT